VLLRSVADARRWYRVNVVVAFNGFGFGEHARLRAAINAKWLRRTGTNRNDKQSAQRSIVHASEHYSLAVQHDRRRTDPAFDTEPNLHTCGPVRYTRMAELLAVIMAALCNRADHYIFMLCFVLLLHMAALRSRCGHYIFFLFLLLLFYSSTNLSGRRMDVYHTSTHDVVLCEFRMQV